jgi:hypothetical protein
MKARALPLRVLIRFTFLTAVVWVGTVTVSAATVRGKIGCAVEQGKVGRPNTKYVTVFNARIGRSKQAPVGPAGMFYLYNIPANRYVLEVWSRSNPGLPPQTFQLNVLEPYTTVPEVTVPC